MDPIPEVPIDPAVLSRDPETGAKYAADPLVYHGPFHRESLEMFKRSVGRRRRGRLVRRPARALDARLRGPAGAPRGDPPRDRANPRPRTEEKVYEGAQHEIFNETNREEVLDDTVEFLHRRWATADQASVSCLPQSLSSAAVLPPVLSKSRSARLRAKPAAVAGEGAVCPDDAVAGDDDRHRRRADRAADAARVEALAGLLGELAGDRAVARRLAERDLAERCPDPLLELGALEVEIELERPALTREVLVELGDRRRQGARVALRRGRKPARKLEGDQVGVGAHQREDSDGAFVTDCVHLFHGCETTGRPFS